MTTRASELNQYRSQIVNAFSLSYSPHIHPRETSHSLKTHRNICFDFLVLKCPAKQTPYPASFDGQYGRGCTGASAAPLTAELGVEVLAHGPLEAGAGLGALVRGERAQLPPHLLGGPLLRVEDAAADAAGAEEPREGVEQDEHDEEVEDEGELRPRLEHCKRRRRFVQV